MSAPGFFALLAEHGFNKVYVFYGCFGGLGWVKCLG